MRRAHLALALLAALAACTPPAPPPQAGPAPPDLARKRSPAPYDTSNGSISLAQSEASEHALAEPEIVMGTGRFVNRAATTQNRPPIVATGSDVALHFANADVRDVLKSVLGDLLQQSYTIDPAVQGTVTLETGSPVPRSAVIGVLTDALQVSGVGLVQRNGMYLAVPVANAGRQGPVGGETGFVTRIVTPRYVSASDLEQALQPVLPGSVTLKADPGRNVLTISGPAQDVSSTVDNVETFDVDYLRGMSFALLPLRNGRARDIAGDINRLLTSSARPIADMVKVAPIERMNAILVTSMQPAYLRRVQDWVERFDRGDGGTEQQLFIYRVQNGRATDLARVLQRALGITATTDATSTGNAANGAGTFDLYPNQNSTGAAADSGLGVIQSTLAGSPSPGSSPTAPPPQAGTQPPRADVLTGGGAAALLGAGATPTSDVRVTADQTNNALIVTATPQEYAPIEAALEKLDITPLQVLIEATVAEVSLTNQLSLGLQYYIKSGNFSAIFAPGLNSANPTSATPDTTATFPGFNLGGAANVLYAAGGTNVVLQALSSLSTVQVLSSPDLLVLNNETARLQVGDQVPVATQSATSTLTNTAQTVNAIQYRDTGVILSITPRVNAGGLVQLDMTEEVSAPVASATTRNFDPLSSPTISTRRVTSRLAINDGQTVCLAGLIRDTQTDSKSGIPLLKDIPGVGFLFGSKSNELRRTELIVLITPYVIRNRGDADAVTDELRQKLRLTIPVAARER